MTEPAAVMFDQARWLIPVVLLMILAGLADSFGFYHGSKVFTSGELHSEDLYKSAAWFGVGSVLFWATTYCLQHFGGISAEVQTACWFGVAIVGVALVSGQFTIWSFTDKLVALAVLAGIGWLLVRTGG
jgi:hypothetical protein